MTELRGQRALGLFDDATTWLERPVRRLAGSHRLNPLPHAGTISVFLLGVVVVSGLYITLFFAFGREASYSSVAAMEDHAIQRVIRALHRYSSAALVLTTMVHAWRIFVSARFTGRSRRWRWATGVASLVLVWLAGVTGYWLVWDVRAQALSEALASVISGFGWGARFAVRSLIGPETEGGSTLLLSIWLVHLGLTAVIGWFVYRHLRRTRMAWLPPRHWMLLMAGSLIVVSIGLPVGMLPPADPTQLVGDMPLDPFILFLLPPLLSAARWVWLIVGMLTMVAIVFLPRLLSRRDPAVVEVSPEECTGCNLCVVDCPYEALELRERSESRPLAVLDPSACVGCGICIGACAFGAISLVGEAPMTTAPLANTDGRSMVVVCDRHDPQQLEADEGTVVVGVRCAGMLSPGSLRAEGQAGASEVHLIGCAPSDCRYGTGNVYAAARMAGERAPQLPRRWSGLVTEDWISQGEIRSALAEPGLHPVAEGDTRSFGREAFFGVGVLVAASVILIAVATRAPFRGADDHATVRVLLDHVAGAEVDLPGGRQSIGTIQRVWPVAGGVELDPRSIGAGEQAVVLDWSVTPDEPDVVIMAEIDGVSQPLAELAGPAAGTRALISLIDSSAPAGVEAGEQIFNARRTGCSVCHSVEEGDDGVGPTLHGVASVAGRRVEGLDAELYLRQSILLPDQYILDGWPSGQMLPIYRDRLNEDELTALITYLLTLTDEGS